MSDTPSSTPAKAKAASTAKLGETVENVSEVTRPNGVTDRVGGTGYVLEHVGTYLIDGTEVTVS